MSDRRELLQDDDEARRLLIESALADVQTAMPGIVESVSANGQTVSIRPAIKGFQPDANGETQTVSLPLLLDVPVCWPRAGGYALTFPIKQGDEVLVVFGSRCIDNWWKFGGEQTQAEIRFHDLSDGFAILAPTSEPKALGNVSTSAVQLRNEAGDTLIEITPEGNIRAKATGKAVIEAPNIELTAATSIKLQAPSITAQGSASVAITSPATTMGGGAVAVQAGLAVSGGLTSGGKNMDTHTHSGVTIGGGNTGPMV